MSRFAKFATGLRDLGNDINANISKALNISKEPEDPNQILLQEAKAGRTFGLEAILEEFGPAASVNGALDRSFHSPLSLACRGGHEEAALFLLRQADADPNNALGAKAAAAAVAEHGNGDVGDGDGRSGGAPSTPLALAVAAGLQVVVEELLARGARVDARRAGDASTPLHLCAARGNALIMEDLLAAPLADAGVRTARLETPLSVASFHGHLSVVDMLLGSNDAADVEVEENATADADGLTASGAGADETAGGRTSAVLVAPGAAGSEEGRQRRQRRGSRRHAEERAWDGRTPLHRAAARGHTEVVLRLLDHGVAVDPTDTHGATPLHLAAGGGHWAAARALVREGEASATVATDDGDTALHAAAWSAAGANGVTADRVVRLLLDCGAEVDARNRFGSTALHMAAAVADHDSVKLLLSSGANPSIINSCGLSPGACFLRPPDALAAAAGSAANVRGIRRTLREHREHFGHVRRLADTSAKRVAVEAVGDRATVAVHRFVEFALKMQRWDLEARTHRTRLRRLDKFRSEILSDPDWPGTAAANTTNNNKSLLLDLSPERESRAAQAVKRRRKAAEEAVKGAGLALRDLKDWKASVLAERAAVASFLGLVDPVRTLAAGASCDGAEGEGEEASRGGGGMASSSFEAEVVVADPAFLAAEGVAEAWSDNGRLRRHASWAGTGADTVSSESSPTSSSTVGSRDGSVERGGRDGGLGGHRSRVPGVGFLRALATLDPCVSALREAKSSARTGDRLGMALETLREHVKATLIDLMDLETSIPGEALDSDGGGEEEDGAVTGGDRGPAASISALSAADAAALDVKVAGLVRRLSGGGTRGSGSGESGEDNGEDAGGSRGPPSLASVYGDGLRGAAAASEAEVDTTESLTARAVRMATGAVGGPLLWALDDAYQRLTKADIELRRLLPDAEALLGGADSAEELARAARSRLVTVRQQVEDEEDLLKELASKLGRRRRQGADHDEIRSIDDERLHVSARLAALRSAKLAELKALRRSRACERFPELLLDHPNAAERAFRALLLNGIAVRDPDEWEDHHLTSVASLRSADDGLGSAGTGGGVGVSETAQAGLGGQGCRLAEVDGSAVAIVEVDCRGRQAERDLVTTLRRFNPTSSTLRPAPEVAAVSAVSLLPDGRAALEVPVEGALTARAWLATLVQPTAEAEPTTAAAVPPGGLPDGTATAAATVNLAGEHSQVETWAVMLQALRGLAAVHALSEDSTHHAVCLSNILVAARSSPHVPAGTTHAAEAAGLRPSPSTQPLHGFRKAQLGPPAPAAFARPSAGCIAPEVVRGQGFGQPADVYAFGCALRAACCGAQHNSSFCATGGGGRVGSGSGGVAAGGNPGVLPAGLGPSFGPLRQALVQLLESMLEEDVSHRCTALEALSSDYFRAPPLRHPNPAYPLQWSQFPVRPRRLSNAPGGQPHWVAVALAGGGLKGDGSASDRSWLDSAFVVEVPLPPPGGGAAGGSRSGSRTPELESSRIESLLRRSVPGARLRRLVRVQDRARMLRFACERDAAVSSAAAASAVGGTRRSATVSRLFADPRDVMTSDALAAIAARSSGAAAGAGAKAGLAWTVEGTSLLSEERDDSTRARGTGGGLSSSRTVRCADSARFAAVAFAPPPTEPGGEGEDDSSNLRTLAIVKAIVGVPREIVGREGTGGGGDASSSGVGGGDGDGETEEDPFSGVDSPPDDLTRVGGIGLSSPPPSLIGGDSGGDGGDCLGLQPAPGLSTPAVHSIKTCEMVGEDEASAWGWRGGGGGTTPVYTLRHDACYPEYLATFSL
eukprot:g9878.t1